MNVLKLVTTAFLQNADCKINKETNSSAHWSNERKFSFQTKKFINRTTSVETADVALQRRSVRKLILKFGKLTGKQVLF